MAVVYKAYDTRLEADVAVKVIRTEKLTEETKERALKRFEREAKALARLTHPNIVKVTDYGDHEGKPYLVMPLLAGGTLKGRLGKPIPWDEAFQILAPIAWALEYAHGRDIIHRDVKPSNILITDSGQPMISDFGVAKILTLEETVDLTGTGMGIGTPEYMAPEQWTGNTTPHSDQYSLGVVLYEMITGCKPYTADTPAAILLKQATEPLPRPGALVSGLPEKVEKLLIKTLARDPKDRYKDMGELAKALEGGLKSVAPVERAKPQPTAKPKGKALDTLATVDQDWDETGTPQSVSTPKLKSRTQTRTEYVREIKQSPKPWYKTWQMFISIGLVAAAFFLFIAYVASRPGASPSAPPTEQSTVTATATIPALSTHTPTATRNPPTPTITPTPTLGIGSTMISKKDGMVMVFVPAGEFTMGSDTGDSDERPERQVYLDSFWIDQTEITNGMYARCVEANQCKSPSLRSNTRSSYFGNPDYDNYPVVHVNWEMAKIYCEWAERKLPTEAEWEKAARGTDGRIYPWGNESPNSFLLNYNRKIDDTMSVGSYPDGESPFGALDMAGNVWEWVADFYSEFYYYDSPLVNPTGPTTGDLRVLRGGSWYDPKSNIRSSNRSGYDYYYTQFASMGFRCSLSHP